MITASIASVLTSTRRQRSQVLRRKRGWDQYSKWEKSPWYVFSSIPTTALGGRAVTIPLKKKRRPKQRSRVSWPMSPNMEVSYGLDFERWIGFPQRDNSRRGTCMLYVSVTCVPLVGAERGIMPVKGKAQRNVHSGWERQVAPPAWVQCN